MTRLIIARHGNTFESHETPRRVGAKTNIPLTSKGRAQGTAIGRYLADHDMIPDRVFTSRLQRTMETAYTALQEAGRPSAPMVPLKIFDEIDYGPDENKTEAEVVARIGQDAITAWDRDATVPPDWNVSPADIIRNWHHFAANLLDSFKDETILVVTSNGIARFAPHILADIDAFHEKHPLKISTGAICVLDHDDQYWSVREWNLKPPLAE